ncbi:hypothetical protein [Petrachloros mirabilis]
MAHCRLITLLLLFGSLMLTGCSQKPLPRMDNYLGVTGQGEERVALVQPQSATGSFDVGLLLINDTSGEGSAPALSDRAKAFLTDQVRQRVEPATPIRVVKVLTLADPSQRQDRQTLAKLAQEQGLSYLLLVLFSSSESEVPLYLPVTGDPEQGGGRPTALGLKTVNYARAELALIDATSAQVIARSDGRAWSRLNDLNVPINSNAYPVIHRSLRVAPIFPPEKDAKDILRSIAGDEALEQAVSKLEQAWKKT